MAISRGIVYKHKVFSTKKFLSSISQPHTNISQPSIQVHLYGENSGGSTLQPTYISGS